MPPNNSLLLRDPFKVGLFAILNIVQSINLIIETNNPEYSSI